MEKLIKDSCGTIELERPAKLEHTGRTERTGHLRLEHMGHTERKERKEHMRLERMERTGHLRLEHTERMERTERKENMRLERMERMERKVISPHVRHCRKLPLLLRR
jgi:hypothetical protein